MSKRQILALIGCMIVGIAVIGLILALSPIGTTVPRHTFSRNFGHEIEVSKPLAIADLGVNSFYFVGATKNRVYLGSYTGPLHMVQATLPKLDTQHVLVNIIGTKIPENYRVFRMKVDSPYFYLSHGTMPGVFKGILSERSASNFMPVNAPFFLDALPVSPTRVALKSLNTITDASELASLTPDSPYFEFKTGILQKQVDGIFCEEGRMLYNKDLNKIVYVYTYRNEYILMDTSLSQVSRHHTIDTFRRAAINVAKVDSRNYKTLASPPMRINVESCTSGRYLYVQSSLLSKNEDDVKFRTNTVFDVYDLVEGVYLTSFYVEQNGGHFVKNFIVTNNYFVAIYDTKLVLYELLTRHDVRAQL